MTAVPGPAERTAHNAQFCMLSAVIGGTPKFAPNGGYAPSQRVQVQDRQGQLRDCSMRWALSGGVSCPANRACRRRFSHC
jgi:hypothetical protein